MRDRSTRSFFRGHRALLLRVAVAAAPPLFVVHALFAGPKGAVAPPKKPVVVAPKAPKDAGALDAAPTDGDASKEPKEKSPIEGKAAGTSGDAESGALVKESEKKEGDASVKVFEFGATEIEGRSRWPAITYFIRRLRAEFEAQKLPHRSFFPELESTKGDPAVK